MNKVVFSGARRNCRMAHSFLLAFFWLCGIACGLLLYTATEYSAVSWMRCITGTSVARKSLFFVTIIPFLLSIAAEYLHALYLIYPLCFLEALEIAFVCCSLFGAFGNAGWMIGFFLLFQNLCSLPILYYYWLRSIRNGRAAFDLGYSVFLLSVVILIYSVDIYMILPFGTRLMNAVIE